MRMRDDVCQSFARRASDQNMLTVLTGWPFEPFWLLLVRYLVSLTKSEGPPSGLGAVSQEKNTSAPVTPTPQPRTESASAVTF